MQTQGGFFVPPRIPLFASSSSDSRADLLQGLLIAALVIAGLYFGREVLLPLALAILLSFVLTPMLLLLRRLKVPRVLGVTIVVSFAFAVILGLGWLFSQQASQLAENFPMYRTAIVEKISVLRSSAESLPGLEIASDAVKDLGHELSKPAPKVGVSSAPSAEPGDAQKPVQVEIHDASPESFALFQTIAGTILSPLATAGIVLLFVIFILLQREELRDRAIRLLAASDLQRATSAMNDAAERLSKYFLSQFFINSAYGAFIAAGLWLLGVPSPIVWGILAMLMRFVPYIGSFIAAAPPLLLAAAIEPTWSTFLLTGALYFVSELTMGQVIEPLVYGHGTGLSPIAVVISAVFWTWLWGPLGLLLAMPLTVCLVVLGRHIEGLNFFQLLLGDEPALTQEQAFYQRALSGDSAEITYEAELALKDEPLSAYLDDVAMKSLQLAERDLERGILDAESTERIRMAVKELMENLSEFEPRRWFGKVAPEKTKDHDIAQTGLASLTAMDEEKDDALAAIDPAELAPGWRDEDAILCIGARNSLDDTASTVLAGLLQKHGLRARALDHEGISEGGLTSLESKVKLVCLSYMGLGVTTAHVRYLIRRLRRILPNAKIVVGYWGENPTAALKGLQANTEADAYATSLHQATEIIIDAAIASPAKADAEGAPPIERDVVPEAISVALAKRTPDAPRPRARKPSAQRA